MTDEQVRHARDLLARSENTVTSIAKLLGVSHNTIYNYVPELKSGRLALAETPDELSEREPYVAAGAEDGDGLAVDVLDQTGVAVALPPAVGDGLQAGLDGGQAVSAVTGGCLRYALTRRTSSTLTADSRRSPSDLPCPASSLGAEWLGHNSETAGTCLVQPAPHARRHECHAANEPLRAAEGQSRCQLHSYSGE
ncbi:helix-turn-helix domain-containing protein [Streptomyces sp. NPDC086549]|uniref:helix-turn-helix domain-containing protein n=1 Tax=Streptomyces sp. NPDC086549 TaxID=3365752 RepID=UPI00381E8E58